MSSNVSFIFASCKEWHRAAYEVIEREVAGQWIWVSNQAELLAAIDSCEPRYVFFLHWSWLVPRKIWEKYECVCFHMTDVPYGRGGSPLQNLIVAGHDSTQLTALRMVEELDAGPVYAKKTLELSGTAQEIYERAGQISADIIRWMVARTPEPTSQTGEVVCFKRRTPDQSRLPESGGAKELYDFIRMLDAEGYPHAFIDYGEHRIEFRNARMNDSALTTDAIILPRKK